MYPRWLYDQTVWQVRWSGCDEVRMVENQNTPLALISHAAEECSQQWVEKETIFVFENDILGIGLFDALIQPVCIPSP